MRFNLIGEGLGEPLEQREQGRHSAVVLYVVVVLRRERVTEREERVTTRRVLYFCCLLITRGREGLKIVSSETL